MLGNAENQVRPMQYPVLAGGSLAAVDCASPADLAARVRELEAALAEREKQFARQLDAARREATEKGRESAGGEQAGWRQQLAGEL